MERVYITNLEIEDVRHLKNVKIPLSQSEMKHLMITGKNGSGKTSVLNAMAQALNAIVSDSEWSSYEKNLETNKEFRDRAKKEGNKQRVFDFEKGVKLYEERIKKAKCGLGLYFSHAIYDLYSMFEKGEFILAFYRDERIFNANVPPHVEKVVLKNNYNIDEYPREEFLKYLLDLKMTQALAATNGKDDKANQIKGWFEKLENLLKRIFDDSTMELHFDEDTFKFSLIENGREVFDFNTLSSGYAAVMDIVVDIIMRMEHQTERKFQFDMPGIVLIDEIETHLHLDLQKNIMGLLTTIFPNIQFIVSTHSPFILNSLENVVIYDLENHVLVKDGLADVPYDGIVEGYFNTNKMSELLKEKYDRYKELVKKEHLSDEDFDEIAKLEFFLDEIPDYLALDITTEYQKIKLEFENREDV